MPYVTSTRELPLYDFSYKFKPASWDAPNEYYKGVFATATQTTTSFRSGRNADSLVTPASILEESKRDAKRGQYDSGHPFSTEREYLATNMDKFVCIGQKGGYYEGAALPYPASGNPSWSKWIDDNPAYNSSELNSMGAKAIANSLPTNSVAGLSQFLGELKEGLPSLILSDLKKAKLSNAQKGLGGEYLNYQFGIVPLINDIKAFAEVAVHSQKYIDWFSDHSDKPVRGQFGFKTVRNFDQRSVNTSGFSSTLDPRAGIWSEDYFPDSTWNNGVTQFLDYSTSRSVWFRGSYQYHLSDATDLRSKAKRYEQLASKLLGSRFTIETLWELTPWSWLIDWKTDIGDVLHNYSAFENDNLVLRYGYLMSKTRWDLNISYDKGLYSVKGKPPVYPTLHRWKIRKERVRSTPYGFGLDPGGFSDKQWAILGALGLTKSPKSLRYSE
jgi:hypothetical protein